MGDNRAEDELCTKKDCSLCAIIRGSYDIDKTGMWLHGLVHILGYVADVNLTGTKHNFSRFGAGIYTSACSSSETLFFPPFSDGRATNLYNRGRRLLQGHCLVFQDSIPRSPPERRRVREPSHVIPYRHLRKFTQIGLSLCEYCGTPRFHAVSLTVIFSFSSA